RKRVVQGHVEGDRHENAAEEIERAAGEQIERAGLAPIEEAEEGKDEAAGRGPEEGGKEPGIDDHHIDGLHGRDPLTGREAAKGTHHESREGEEDAGDQCAAEGRNDGQSNDGAGHRCALPTPVAEIGKASDRTLRLLLMARLLEYE